MEEKNKKKFLTNKQCKSCPWLVHCEPDKDIPYYIGDKHQDLVYQIAIDGEIPDMTEPVKMMSCHYFDPEDQQPCIGFIQNQCNEWSNVGVRLNLSMNYVREEIILAGEQHLTFRDTLPKWTILKPEVELRLQVIEKSYQHRKDFYKKYNEIFKK